MTWVGNGSANFDEIWQVVPSWTILLHLRELAPIPLHCLAVGKTYQTGTKYQTLQLLELPSEDAFCNIFDSMHTKRVLFPFFKYLSIGFYAADL